MLDSIVETMFQVFGKFWNVLKIKISRVGNIFSKILTTCRNYKFLR